MLALKIILLDDTVQILQAQTKATGRQIFEQVCRQLNLLESDYFGIEYLDCNSCNPSDLLNSINSNKNGPSSGSSAWMPQVPPPPPPPFQAPTKKGSGGGRPATLLPSKEEEEKLIYRPKVNVNYGHYFWLDMDKRLNRQVGLSLSDPILRFCVKFYNPDPIQLEEEFTRYLFSLQIKRDLATGILICNENTAALMASYILQAECGDFASDEPGSSSSRKPYKFHKLYFPWQTPENEAKILENHKKHYGQSPEEADLNLLETARRTEFYGAKLHPVRITGSTCQSDFNCDIPDFNILNFPYMFSFEDASNCYSSAANGRKGSGAGAGGVSAKESKAARKKSAKSLQDDINTYYLNVGYNGIQLYNHIPRRIQNFPWIKIRKLSFKRKRFIIKLILIFHNKSEKLTFNEIVEPESFDKNAKLKSVETQVEFIFGSRDSCKNFWKKCVEHHTFFRCEGNPSTAAYDEEDDGSRRSLFNIFSANPGRRSSTKRGVPQLPLSSGAAPGTSQMNSLGAGGDDWDRTSQGSGGYSQRSLGRPSGANPNYGSSFKYTGRTQREMKQFIRDNFNLRRHNSFNSYYNKRYPNNPRASGADSEKKVSQPLIPGEKERKEASEGYISSGEGSANKKKILKKSVSLSTSPFNNYNYYNNSPGPAPAVNAYIEEYGIVNKLDRSQEHISSASDPPVHGRKSPRSIPTEKVAKEFQGADVPGYENYNKAAMLYETRRRYRSVDDEDFDFHFRGGSEERQERSVSRGSGSGAGYGLYSSRDDGDEIEFIDYYNAYPPQPHTQGDYPRIIGAGSGEVGYYDNRGNYYSRGQAEAARVVPPGRFEGNPQGIPGSAFYGTQTSGDYDDFPVENDDIGDEEDEEDEEEDYDDEFDQNFRGAGGPPGGGGPGRGSGGGGGGGAGGVNPNNSYRYYYGNPAHHQGGRGGGYQPPPPSHQGGGGGRGGIRKTFNASYDTEADYGGSEPKFWDGDFPGDLDEKSEVSDRSFRSHKKHSKTYYDENYNVSKSLDNISTLSSSLREFPVTRLRPHKPHHTKSHHKVKRNSYTGRVQLYEFENGGLIGEGGLKGSKSSTFDSGGVESEFDVGSTETDERSPIPPLAVPHPIHMQTSSSLNTSSSRDDGEMTAQERLKIKRNSLTKIQAVEFDTEESADEKEYRKSFDIDVIPEVEVAVEEPLIVPVKKESPVNGFGPLISPLVSKAIPDPEKERAREKFNGVVAQFAKDLKETSPPKEEILQDLPEDLPPPPAQMLETPPIVEEIPQTPPIGLEDPLKGLPKPKAINPLKGGRSAMLKKKMIQYLMEEGAKEDEPLEIKESGESEKLKVQIIVPDIPEAEKPDDIILEIKEKPGLETIEEKLEIEVIPESKSPIINPLKGGRSNVIKKKMIKFLMDEGAKEDGVEVEVKSVVLPPPEVPKGPIIPIAIKPEPIYDEPIIEPKKTLPAEPPCKPPLPPPPVNPLKGGRSNVIKKKMIKFLMDEGAKEDEIEVKEVTTNAPKVQILLPEHKPESKGKFGSINPLKGVRSNILKKKMIKFLMDEGAKEEEVKVEVKQVPQIPKVQILIPDDIPPLIKELPPPEEIIQINKPKKRKAPPPPTVKPEVKPVQVMQTKVETPKIVQIPDKPSIAQVPEKPPKPPVPSLLKGSKGSIIKKKMIKFLMDEGAKENEVSEPEPIQESPQEEVKNKGPPLQQEAKNVSFDQQYDSDVSSFGGGNKIGIEIRVKSPSDTDENNISSDGEFIRTPSTQQYTTSEKPPDLIEECESATEPDEEEAEDEYEGREDPDGEAVGEEEEDEEAVEEEEVSSGSCSCSQEIEESPCDQDSSSHHSGGNKGGRSGGGGGGGGGNRASGQSNSGQSSRGQGQSQQPPSRGPRGGGGGGGGGQDGDDGDRRRRKPARSDSSGTESRKGSKKGGKKKDPKNEDDEKMRQDKIPYLLRRHIIDINSFPSKDELPGSKEPKPDKMNLRKWNSIPPGPTPFFMRLNKLRTKSLLVNKSLAKMGSVKSKKNLGKNRSFKDTTSSSKTAKGKGLYNLTNLFYSLPDLTCMTQDTPTSRQFYINSNNINKYYYSNYYYYWDDSVDHFNSKSLGNFPGISGGDLPGTGELRVSSLEEYLYGLNGRINQESFNFLEEMKLEKMVRDSKGIPSQVKGQSGDKKLKNLFFVNEFVEELIGEGFKRMGDSEVPRIDLKKISPCETSPGLAQLTPAQGGGGGGNLENIGEIRPPEEFMGEIGETAHFDCENENFEDEPCPPEDFESCEEVTEELVEEMDSYNDDGEVYEDKNFPEFYQPPLPDPPQRSTSLEKDEDPGVNADGEPIENKKYKKKKLRRDNVKYIQKMELYNRAMLNQANMNKLSRISELEDDEEVYDDNFEELVPKTKVITANLVQQLSGGGKKPGSFESEDEEVTITNNETTTTNSNSTNSLDKFMEKIERRIEMMNSGSPYGDPALQEIQNPYQNLKRPMPRTDSAPTKSSTETTDPDEIVSVDFYEYPKNVKEILYFKKSEDQSTSSNDKTYSKEDDENSQDLAQAAAKNGGDGSDKMAPIAQISSITENSNFDDEDLTNNTLYDCNDDELDYENEAEMVLEEDK